MMDDLAQDTDPQAHIEWTVPDYPEVDDENAVLKPAERLARIADILETPDDYGMMEPILLNWKHALKEIASKLPSKQLQEQLLSSTAKANERLAKKLRWELSQIAADALASINEGEHAKMKKIEALAAKRRFEGKDRDNATSE